MLDERAALRNPQRAVVLDLGVDDGQRARHLGHAAGEDGEHAPAGGAAGVERLHDGGVGAGAVTCSVPRSRSRLRRG
jgi:hypothetical protein